MKTHAFSPLATRLAVSLSILFIAASFSFTGKAQPASGSHDGSHDFDFNIGTWKTHITRSLHPLTGSKETMKLEGTVTVRKVWGGKAELEEIEADGPKGHWEGLTLFLYNPQSHKWSQNYAGASDGTLETPDIGEFKNGIGVLYSHEIDNGKNVLVRGTWSQIKPNSHQYKIELSADGGKTWETSFLANLERTK